MNMCNCTRCIMLLLPINLDRRLSQPLAKNVVVAVWDVQELHSASSEILDGGDDVKRPGVHDIFRVVDIITIYRQGSSYYHDIFNARFCHDSESYNLDLMIDHLMAICWTPALP